jgi:hypothetical protein
MFNVSTTLWLNYWTAYGAPFAETALALYHNWCAPDQRRRWWFAGVTPGIPVNNCGLEAYNGTLKKGANEHAPLGESMHHIKEWIEGQSAMRNPDYVNGVRFASLPIPSASTWVDALQLKMEFNGRTVKLVEVKLTGDEADEPGIFYIIAPIGSNSAKHGDLFADNATDEEIAARAKILVLKLVFCTWFDLDELVAFYRNYTIVGTWLHDKDISFCNEVVQGRRNCHCAQFTREFVCKHSLAVQLHLKEVNLPDGIAQFKHTGKRRRGAPKKASGNGRYGASLFAHVSSDEEENSDGHEHEEQDV